MSQERKKQAVNRTSVSTSAPVRSVPLKGVRIRKFRNEFAFDSNFVLTQLRSSNFPDSLQVCSCSALKEKLEFIGKKLQFKLNFRSKSQDGDF